MGEGFQVYPRSFRELGDENVLSYYTGADATFETADGERSMNLVSQAIETNITCIEGDWVSDTERVVGALYGYVEPPNSRSVSLWQRQPSRDSYHGCLALA